MKVAILSADKGWHIEQLKNAIKARGCSVWHTSFKSLQAQINMKPAVRGDSEEKIMDECKYVFVRIIPGGSLEQIILRMDILHRLENMGIKVINSPGSIEKTVNKYYTSFLLADKGLPTPRTMVTENFSTAIKFYREEKDVVLKPLFGSLGRGMIRLTDEETAYRVFRAWEMNNYVFYLQEFIPHANKDIRVFICGGKIIAAYWREASSWKTNIARGAKGKKIDITKQLRNIAQSAVSLLGLDYAGVDIILKDGNLDKPSIIEINSIPGWSGLQKVTGINVAETIVNNLII